MTYEALSAAERHSVRENAKRDLALAGYQYARLCLGELAIEIRETFPAADTIVIDVDYDDSATLWRINDATGTMLWNREADQPSELPLAIKVGGLYADAHAHHPDSCGIVLDQGDDSHGTPDEDVHRHIFTLPAAAPETVAPGETPAIRHNGSAMPKDYYEIQARYVMPNHVVCLPGLQFRLVAQAGPDGSGLIRVETHPRDGESDGELLFYPPTGLVPIGTAIMPVTLTSSHWEEVISGLEAAAEGAQESVNLASEGECSDCSDLDGGLCPDHQVMSKSAGAWLTVAAQLRELIGHPHQAQEVA